MCATDFRPDPGGFTRMVGQARQDITIKNPEEYTEFAVRIVGAG